MKVYYNPRCNKCRAAKKFLDDNGKEYELFEYLDQSFNEEDIKEILIKGNLSANDILRKNEKEYEHYIKGRNLSEEEIIKLIVKYPIMLQRPIIVTKYTAIIARDEKTLEKLKNL